MWPESLSSNLPPPHADEPVSLRQDIADELADHLAAALQDQRLRGADESTARQLVLQRFGDPSQVAQQLWVDAMKEPIMRQRALLVLAALLVVGVFAANGLAWMAFRQLRESNAALVARLEGFSAPRSPVESADLTFELVKEGSGAPAVGYGVELLGSAVDADSPLTLEQTSDARGHARFGPIRPGSYTYWVSAPWKWRTERQGLAILAGQTARRIECPPNPKPPQESHAKINVVWPGELNERLALACEFVPSTPRFSIGDVTWTKATGFRVVRDLNGKSPATVQGPHGSDRDEWLLGRFAEPPTQEMDADTYDLATFSVLRRTGRQDGPTRAGYQTIFQGEGSIFGQFAATAADEAVWTIEVPAHIATFSERELEAMDKEERVDSAGDR
ncbi:MAG: carboxypeptidase-like regulatory domain-containing protein [Pirellulales bacterium]